MSAKTTLRFFFKVKAAGCIILVVYGTFSSLAANPLKNLLWERVHENGSGSTHARFYSVQETELFEIIIFLAQFILQLKTTVCIE